MAEPFLSDIRIMSFGYAPKGWAMYNGQLLPINQNQALFSLLGTTFGGGRARRARRILKITSAHKRACECGLIMPAVVHRSHQWNSGRSRSGLTAALRV